MGYGTYLFPRLHKQGSWVLQTDRREIIDLMQERPWESKSPWRQCLWGTSFGYTRDFHSARDAKESVTRILNKLPLQAFDFTELGDGKGWEIKIACSPHNAANLCAYTGDNQEQQSTKAA